MLEKEIQKSCIDYLNIKHIFNFKINNVGIKKENGSYIPSQTKGLPDLVFHFHSKVHYCEFKTKTGKLSEFQEIFMEQCIKDDVPYHIIRDLDDLLFILKELEWPRYEPR